MLRLRLNYLKFKKNYYFFFSSSSCSSSLINKNNSNFFSFFHSKLLQEDQINDIIINQNNNLNNLNNLTLFLKKLSKEQYNYNPLQFNIITNSILNLSNQFQKSQIDLIISSLRYTDLSTNEMIVNYNNILKSLFIQLENDLKSNSNQSISFNDISKIVSNFNTIHSDPNQVSNFLKLFQKYLANDPGHPFVLKPALNKLSEIQNIPEISEFCSHILSKLKFSDLSLDEITDLKKILSSTPKYAPKSLKFIIDLIYSKKKSIKNSYSSFNSKLLNYIFYQDKYPYSDSLNLVQTYTDILLRLEDNGIYQYIDSYYLTTLFLPLNRFSSDDLIIKRYLKAILPHIQYTHSEKLNSQEIVSIISSFKNLNLSHEGVLPIYQEIIPKVESSTVNLSFKNFGSILIPFQSLTLEQPMINDLFNNLVKRFINSNNLEQKKIDKSFDDDLFWAAQILKNIPKSILIPVRSTELDNLVNFILKTFELSTKPVITSQTNFGKIFPILLEDEQITKKLFTFYLNDIEKSNHQLQFFEIYSIFSSIPNWNQSNKEIERAYNLLSKNLINYSGVWYQDMIIDLLKKSTFSDKTLGGKRILHFLVNKLKDSKILIQTNEVLIECMKSLLLKDERNPDVKELLTIFNNYLINNIPIDTYWSSLDIQMTLSQFSSLSSNSLEVRQLISTITQRIINKQQYLPTTTTTTSPPSSTNSLKTSETSIISNQDLNQNKINLEQFGEILKGIKNFNPKHNEVNELLGTIIKRLEVPNMQTKTELTSYVNILNGISLMNDKHPIIQKILSILINTYEITSPIGTLSHQLIIDVLLSLRNKSTDNLIIDKLYQILYSHICRSIEKYGSISIDNISKMLSTFNSFDEYYEPTNNIFKLLVAELKLNNNNNNNHNNNLILSETNFINISSSLSSRTLLKSIKITGNPLDINKLDESIITVIKILTNSMKCSKDKYNFEVYSSALFSIQRMNIDIPEVREYLTEINVGMNHIFNEKSKFKLQSDELFLDQNNWKLNLKSFSNIFLGYASISQIYQASSFHHSAGRSTLNTLSGSLSHLSGLSALQSSKILYQLLDVILDGCEQFLTNHTLFSSLSSSSSSSYSHFYETNVNELQYLLSCLILSNHFTLDIPESIENKFQNIFKMFEDRNLLIQNNLVLKNKLENSKLIEELNEKLSKVTENSNDIKFYPESHKLLQLFYLKTGIKINCLISSRLGIENLESFLGISILNDKFNEVKESNQDISLNSRGSSLQIKSSFSLSSSNILSQLPSKNQLVSLEDNIGNLTGQWIIQFDSNDENYPYKKREEFLHDLYLQRKFGIEVKRVEIDNKEIIDELIEELDDCIDSYRS